MPRCASCGSNSRPTGDDDLRDRLILHYSPLVKYVAGRVGVGLPPEHRAGRPRLLRHLRADRRDRQVRPRARDQVRDLRDRPHPRRDHRRAAQHRLDPALGPLKAREVEQAYAGARGQAAAHPDRGRGRRRDGHRARGPAHVLQPGLLRQRRRPRRAAARRRRGGRQAHPRRHPGGHQGATTRSRLFETEETKYILAKAINTLPEREKIVVTLYYYEGLTLAEIGQVLGVTESRICQMHTKAVLQLRGKLADPPDA